MVRFWILNFLSWKLLTWLYIEAEAVGEPASILLVILWLIFAHNIEMVYCVVLKVVCSSWGDPVQAVRFGMVEINSLSDCVDRTSASLWKGNTRTCESTSSTLEPLWARPMGTPTPTLTSTSSRKCELLDVNTSHMHAYMYAFTRVHTHTHSLSHAPQGNVSYLTSTLLLPHTLPQETVNLIRL